MLFIIIITVVVAGRSMEGINNVLFKCLLIRASKSRHLSSPLMFVRARGQRPEAKHRVGEFVVCGSKLLKILHVACFASKLLYK